MDANRKAWNIEQQELQTVLEDRNGYERARAIFLDHHARVHSSLISKGDLWSFEDEVLDGLAEADYRLTPANEIHSLVWILWHLARIEDVTMNILVADVGQIFQGGNWDHRIGLDCPDTGNAMGRQDIDIMNKKADVNALKAYRCEVGRQTRVIVNNLQASDLRKKIEPGRLARIISEGAVQESTLWLIEYWGKKTVAGLLLMPPTRHNFVHLNEAERIKGKLKKKVR